MRQTMRLGRFAGIPVGVHWSVLVIMLLLVQSLATAVLPAGASGHTPVLYWSVAVIVTVVFLAALLAHELVHALVARHYGIPVRAITLWLLGGVSELEGEAPHARGDLLIALAGPLVNLAAAAVFAAGAAGAYGWHAGALTVAALSWLAVVNGIIGVFNLLPGAPLDGGRVLAAALWWRSGDRAAARRTAGKAGVLLGGLLLGYGLLEIFVAANLDGMWLVLLGWFLSAAARAETTDAALRTTLAGVRVGDAMTTPAVCGCTSQTVATFVATVACRHPYRVFPVLDLDGRLTGQVSLARLGRVPAADRDRVRLGDVQTPLARVQVLDPGTPLVEAAPTLLAGGHRLAPVATDGRPVGVLTTGDVSRTVELGTLGGTPRRISETVGPT